MRLSSLSDTEATDLMFTTPSNAPHTLEWLIGLVGDLQAGQRHAAKTGVHHLRGLGL